MSPEFQTSPPSEEHIDEPSSEKNGSHAGGLVYEPGNEGSGEFLHCGEPMKLGGSSTRSIYASISTDSSEDPLLDVYLQTRVLRCPCGFQMELPMMGPEESA